MGKLIHRVGTQDVPKFGGIRLECDPGALPANRFRRLINARISAAPGGPIKSRGGQAKYGKQAPGCIRGVFQPEYDFSQLQPCGKCSDVWESVFADVTAPSLYISTELIIQYQDGTTQLSGPVMLYFNDGQFPKMRQIGAPDQLPWRQVQPGLQGYERAMFSPDGITAYVAADMYHGPFGPTESDIVFYSFTRGKVPTEVARIVGAQRTNNVYDVLAFDGSNFYLSTADTGFDWAIYRLVGTTFSLDDSGSLAPGGKGQGIFGRSGSDLYFGASSFSAGTTYSTNVRIRSGGIWSPVTPPVGHVIEFVGPDEFVSFGGALYFAGRSHNATQDHIYKLVGTTNTVEQTAAAGYVYVGPMASFNGSLWYINLENQFAHRTFLGRFDGVTWNDTYRDISSDYPMNGLLGGFVVGMRVLGGKLRLYVVGDSSLNSLYGNCRTTILSSQGTDLSVPFVVEECRHYQFSYPRQFMTAIS